MVFLHARARCAWFAFALALPLWSACEARGRPEGWSEATHAKGAQPNYEKVFDLTRVQELHLDLTPEDAAAMRDDLELVASGQKAEDPLYVPATVHYDGDVWESVGVRYRGSLKAFAEDGVEKLSLRLNFDHFEDDDPAIHNQRFHGFQELVLHSNSNDPSLVREVFAGELLRDRGVVAARSAFVALWVDAGEGPTYWGLYTLLEDPSDDPMLETQFSALGGNLYRAAGPGADWWDFHEDSYDKKSNQEQDDYGDIQGAIDALLADTTPRADWRAALEARFDVDGFLRWLAVDTLMQNEDSYGKSAENYFLYGEPAEKGRLHFIPWDHNQAFDADGDGPPDVDPSDEMFHAFVSDRWPLIHHLMADDTYRARYAELLDHARGGLFREDRALSRLQELHALIAPHVVGEGGEQAPFTHLRDAAEFEDSIDGERGLAEHLRTRLARVDEALAASR